MSFGFARAWDTPVSKQIAADISSMAGLYCGPATVVWIAAVWNNLQGRSYDYKARLKDRKLFADGPRAFHLNLPAFQKNLNDLLLAETDHELKLSREIYFNYRSIYEIVATYNMPVIIRMPAPKFKDGLHYLTVYKAEMNENSKHRDQIQFYWQDNGVYGDNAASSGLSKSGWRSVRSNFLFWGASRVVRVE